LIKISISLPQENFSQIEVLILVDAGLLFLRRWPSPAQGKPSLSNILIIMKVPHNEQIINIWSMEASKESDSDLNF
jgi:hypothetical protein